MQHQPPAIQRHTHTLSLATHTHVLPFYYILTHGRNIERFMEWVQLSNYCCLGIRSTLVECCGFCKLSLGKVVLSWVSMNCSLPCLLSPEIWFMNGARLGIRWIHYQLFIWTFEALETAMEFMESLRGAVYCNSPKHHNIPKDNNYTRS